MQWWSTTGKEESVHNTGRKKKCSSGTKGKKSGERAPT